MIWIAFIVNLLAEIQFWESPDKDDISIAKIQTFLIFDENRIFIFMSHNNFIDSNHGTFCNCWIIK